MNTLFCINNSVLSNVHWLSKNVIEWHDKDALGLNNVETRMNGLYEGNRNQYYSAIGNYEISLRLRIASTIRQGAKLLAFLDVEDSTYFKKFLSMFGIERITSDIDKTVVPENIAIALHRSFWEEIIKIIEQVNNDPKYDDILESLFRLAMGYRVIAYEINKMSPDTTKNYRQLVSLGCESADISVFIFESDLIQQEKEQFSSEIRRIQIYSKLSDQNIDGLTNLANWCIKAINTYIDNSSSYGLGVGELLLESVEGAQERISKSSDTTLKKTIEKKIKELSSCLFEC